MAKKIIQYRKSDLYTAVVDRYEIFSSNYDFLIFTAIIGYRNNSPDRNNFKGNDETKGEIGLDNIYGVDLYRTIVSCLAYQDKGKPEALVNSKMQMDILAQYASGGLKIAEEEFGDVAGDPTDAIINYIKDNQEDDPDLEGELKRIYESFNNEMMN